MKPLSAALLLVLLFFAPAFAQEASPQFAEEIEVRVIDIDVVVTDRDGTPIRNLTKEDFELFEDGRKVEIDYFTRVEGGRIADLPASGDAGVAMPDPRIPITWVIYIDQTNLLPQRRNAAMRQVQLFVDKAVNSDDQALIAINDGRTFRIRQNITSDIDLLRSTLQEIEKERVVLSPTRTRTGALLNQMRMHDSEMTQSTSALFRARDDTEFNAMTTGNEISTIIAEEAVQAKASIRSVGALLDALAQVPGRLALLYVGAGFSSTPAANITSVWRSRYGMLGPVSYEPKPENERPSIDNEISRLYNNLSAHRVTVYTIHGGEEAGGPTSVEDRGQMEVEVNNNSNFDELVQTGNAREMAQRTGGLYFRLTPGLDKRLEAVRRDFEDYYSIGYRPTGDASKTRDVKVKIKGAGRVRHREAVREKTRSERASGTVVAAAVQPPLTVQRLRRAAAPVVAPAAVSDSNPLGISVQAERPKRQEGGTHLLPFGFSIQLETLTFVRKSDGDRAEFVMHFDLVAEDGTVYRIESREQRLSVPDRSNEEAMADLISYAWHVDLAPLQIPQEVPIRDPGMKLLVTVEDNESGRRSVVTVPLGAQNRNRGS